MKNINYSIKKIRKEREQRRKKYERIRKILVLFTVLFLGIFIGSFFLQSDFSITGFASGALPTVGGDAGNWGNILNTYLSQEHTASGGHKNVTIDGSLDVQGNGNFSGNLNVTGNVTANNLFDSSGGIISIPSGAVMYFNTTTCPTGWNEMVSAQGRYLVGVSGTGRTIGDNGIAGTAFTTNLENRTVGQHSHTFTGDALGTHAHNVGVRNVVGTGGTSPASSTAGSDTYNKVTTAVSAGTPTGTNANSGSVAGTNAPYIQLLVCVKT